jgi:argininosuccinate lyase
VHLSRFAEEIVIWTSPLTGLMRLSDKFTTGSSIMPQKRNPDAAELVRAKAGGSPARFRPCHRHEGAAARLSEGHAGGQGRRDGRACRAVALHRRDGRHGARHRAGCRAHEEGGGRGLCHRDRPRRLAGADAQHAVPQAHHVTGRIVAEAAKAGLPLHRVPLEEMQKVEPGITDDVFKVLSVDRSVQSRTSYGGTAPKNVRRRPGAG